MYMYYGAYILEHLSNTSNTNQSLRSDISYCIDLKLLHEANGVQKGNV